MAINDTRSMTADLKLGVRDGRYKSLTPSRGGNVDVSTVSIRSTELPLQYGVTVTHNVDCACGSC
jgi:hypothetical protein